MDRNAQGTPDTEHKQVLHSGQLEGSMKDLPREGRELPYPLAEDILTTPDSLVALDTAETPTQTEKKSKKKLMIGLGTGAAGIALAATAFIGINSLNQAPNNEPVATTPADPTEGFPYPEDETYNDLAFIGDKSDYMIGEIDRLVGFFSSPEVTRDALINALSQASQDEIDRVRVIVDNYDNSDDGELTELLGKYGLATNEVFWNPLQRISEKNDLSEGEILPLYDNYPDMSVEQVRNALADLSQNEADFVRDWVNGTGDSAELNNMLRKHGLELHDGYLG